MKLNDLDEQELTAFMALLKQLIRADGELSDSEIDHLSALGSVIGEERWKVAFAGVKGQWKQASDIPELAGMVTRPESRGIIHRTLATVAASDKTSAEERAILNTLSKLWTLPIADLAKLPGLPGTRRRSKRGLTK